MYTVRGAQIADSRAMAMLAVQLGYECTDAQVQQRLRDMNDPKEHCVLVALLAAQVAGWVAVSLFRSVELDPFAEITGLVVDESLRSRGIGKELLHAAEVWAVGADCSVISVHSSITRERAHQFYSSNGYELIKTQNFFFKNL